jgi:ribonuclease P protein component
MLAKKFRFPIQNRKAAVFKTIRGSNNYFVVKAAVNDLPYSRFGVVISKKVDKKATKRNEIKRIVFGFIQTKKFYQLSGKDVLIIILPPVRNLEKSEIGKRLELSFSGITS